MSGNHPIGVTAEQLIERFPRLWHMAEAGSWPSIKRNGLRSTTALLDLFEYSGSERTAIEARRRPASVAITHPQVGTAVIRDNKPMYESVLERTLVGYTPEEWYRLLNGKVFFWVRKERLDKLRNAALYRERKHLILTVDTEKLLRRHGERVTLSTMNSGATYPGAQYKRGTGTFEPLPRFRWAERLETHPKEPVVEFAVDYCVPDIGDLVLSREEA